MRMKLIALLIPAVIAGCAVGPDFKTPTTTTNATFINSAAIFNAGEVDKAFWRRFNDATLNQLIDDAAKANTDIEPWFCCG